MSRRLLIFAPNWLGDAVMALPAVADVRRGLPGAVIDMAARASIAPLLPLVPGIGQAVVFGKASDSLASIRSGEYNTVLLLTNSFNSAWLARRSGVPNGGATAMSSAPCC